MFLTYVTAKKNCNASLFHIIIDEGELNQDEKQAIEKLNLAFAELNEY